jgi:cell fate regulator YaaT (PSP1 superfamily)
MACNSCGTDKGGTSAGCRSNGTCGTGGCNKLNVYNWLNDMTLPHGQQPYPIVEVRFKGSRKEFFLNKENVELKVGDVVAVEASPGHDVGVVSMVGELVRFQLRKKNIQETSDQIKALYRKAKPNELEKYYEVKDKESPTLHRTREIILALRLSMKLSDVEYQGDGKKATFFYTADDRVDFRELIKKLAEEFRIRIEMRQIGMRQEASRLGGIGVCGRELCCSTWLTDFKTVSTSTARYQNLALNPAKLAGQCTKLKCCLNYELDSYMDALKDLPSTNIILETEKGRAFHRKTDIFKRLVWYAFSVDEKKEQRELVEGGEAGNWVMLSVDRVKEIIELNKQKIKPTDLALPVEEELEYIPDYENVVGQDRIDRMDKLKKKKKKKKKPSGERTVQSVTANTDAEGTLIQNTNTSQPPRSPQQRPPQRQQSPRPQGQPGQQSGKPQQQRPPQQQGGNQNRPQQQPRPQQQNNPKQQNQNRPPRTDSAPSSTEPSSAPKPNSNRPPRTDSTPPTQESRPAPQPNSNRPPRQPRQDPGNTESPKQ